ncbi:MAG: hypothetical protein U1E45_07265 [Geminicoccaceae bacterium]
MRDPLFRTLLTTALALVPALAVAQGLPQSFQAGFDLSRPLTGCARQNGSLVQTSPVVVTGNVVATSGIADTDGNRCTYLTTDTGTALVWGTGFTGVNAPLTGAAAGAGAAYQPAPAATSEPPMRANAPAAFQAGFGHGNSYEGCSEQNGMLVRGQPITVSGNITGRSVRGDVDGNRCTILTTQYGSQMVWGQLIP